MPLSREQVEHIAALCRVAMSPAEKERMQAQLSNILDQFEVLKGLDTSNVEPSAHSVDLHSTFRKDESRPSLPPAEVLRNAPRQEDGYLRIKAVLEE